ncbi:hypothetical protein CEXT_450161 [Caerostris extrusa]|uniref:Uncharacterized protein n=1 Tax=Caerostris extrusa TaxID=172846 RepID=A0AAV4XQT3_CAEEX|nr:hypothetical protein CEXT_450161 [Caerostris extrusa]
MQEEKGPSVRRRSVSDGCGHCSRGKQRVWKLNLLVGICGTKRWLHLGWRRRLLQREEDSLSLSLSGSSRQGGEYMELTLYGKSLQNKNLRVDTINL